MRNKNLLQISVLVGLLALILSVAYVYAQDTEVEFVEATSPILWFADQSEAGEATLIRSEYGIYAHVETTGLQAGDAVTLWWVIFNEPQNCSDGVCGENDIFNFDENEELVLNEDASMPLNFEGLASAQIAIARADGHVIDVDGDAVFQGFLPAGGFATEDLMGLGLVDALKAEVHLVVRTHGQAIPGQVDEMINTFNGGCSDAFPNEPCEDIQFAVFPPSSLD